MSLDIKALHELVVQTKAKVDAIPGLIATETSQLTALIEMIKTAPPLEDPNAIALQEEIISILSAVNTNLDSIGEGIKSIAPDIEVVPAPTEPSEPPEPSEPQPSAIAIDDEDAEIE
jgi:hypothetical protein